MDKIPSWLVAALGLIAGFAVAITTTRFVGGIILIGLGAFAFYLWWKRRNAATALALLGAYVVAFVASHFVTDVIGPWPSVLAVAGLVAAAAWWFVDRDARRSAGSG